MRKKDEEWPRTGTFCAAWGRISVMQWPIFTGHFEALRVFFHFGGLTMRSVTCTRTVEPAMLKRHFGVHFSLSFSNQPKSLQGLITTIVGQVAVPFFGPIGHPTPRSAYRTLVVFSPLF